jgi:ribonuclease HII
VVAARSTALLPKELTDSKKLSGSKREQLAEQLQKLCQFGEGWVEPGEIDELGLTKAMQLGVSRALIALQARPEEQILMDGHINYCPTEFINIECIVRGDSLHKTISAASVYAKVKRDRHMHELSRLYPDYGFDKHVGYGTSHHMQMLKLHGVCRIHRLSYKPVRAFL